MYTYYYKDANQPTVIESGAAYLWYGGWDGKNKKRNHKMAQKF